MKKIWFIVTIYSFFVFVGYLSFSQTTVKYRYEEEKSMYIFLFCEELQGVKMDSNAVTITEKALEAFSYLTVRNNALPVGYHNYVNYSTLIIDYQLDEDIFTINVSNDFYRTKNEYKALKQLYYTYLFLGLKINLLVDGEELKSFGGIKMNKYLDNIVSNPCYKQIEGSKIVNIFYLLKNENIRPVSYFVNQNYNLQELIEEPYGPSVKLNEENGLMIVDIDD